MQWDAVSTFVERHAFGNRDYTLFGRRRPVSFLYQK